MARHREQFDAEERAYRLREVGEEPGATHKELAERMALTQPGHLGSRVRRPRPIRTRQLRAYVEPLGGTVEFTATFGEREVILSDGHHSAA